MPGLSVGGVDLSIEGTGNGEQGTGRGNGAQETGEREGIGELEPRAVGNDGFPPAFPPSRGIYGTVPASVSPSR